MKTGQTHIINNRYGIKSLQYWGSWEWNYDNHFVDGWRLIAEHAKMDSISGVFF